MSATLDMPHPLFFGKLSEAKDTLANFDFDSSTVIIMAVPKSISLKDTHSDEIVKASNFMREALMRKKAKDAVLKSGDWIDAKQICTLADLSTINPSAQPHKWKKNQKIFSIKHKNIEYYPTYALDAENEYRPLKAVSEIIKVFNDNGWKLAFWFNANNSYLGGKRPKDLISKNPDRVIHAAKIQAQGIQHG